MASTQHYSETDSIGGCTVHGFEGSELTISDGNLYALDIVNAPNLTTLNVAQLQADKAPHLLLKNLPKLQRIILPANHPGAVIHLTSEEAPGELHIDGPVCEIDGAWPGVQFRQEVSNHRKNWDRVTLCSTSDAGKASKTAGLVIVTGATPTELDHLCLDNHCDWLLTDIDGVNHLQITTTGSVAVDQLPSLRTLFSTNHQLQLSLTRTPRLRRVAGGGALVSIRQSDWQEKQLTIDGRWTHARIASDRLEKLSFKDGRSLTVYHCSRLKAVDLALGMDIECHGALPAPLAESARFFFDEATLNHNIEALRAGDASVLPVTLRVLSGAHEPGQVVHCLQQLAELCELGIAADRIWQCRRELAARHRNARSRRKTRGLRPLNNAAMAKADFSWHWHLPDDLAPQGWEADLAIWVYCQETVTAAADFGNVMAHTCQEPMALDTLIRQAGVTGDHESLRPLALQTIEQYVRRNADYMLNRNRRCSNDPTQRLMRLFTNSSTTPEQRRIIIVFLLNIIELDQLLKSVPQILHQAPGLVRSELMALSRKPERWFIPRIPSLRIHRTQPTVDRYRSKLMQAALAPSSSPAEKQPSQPGTTLPLFSEAH